MQDFRVRRRQFHLAIIHVTHHHHRILVAHLLPLLRGQLGRAKCTKPGLREGKVCIAASQNMRGVGHTSRRIGRKRSIPTPLSKGPRVAVVANKRAPEAVC